MTTQIFYYTGTGNSLWIAKNLAEKLENEELHFIPNTKNLSNMDLTNVGFVFPVYIWGVPAPILEFIENLQNFNPEYCFAIAVNGGQVAIQYGKKTPNYKRYHHPEVKLNEILDICTRC